MCGVSTVFKLMVKLSPRLILPSYYLHLLYLDIILIIKQIKAFFVFSGKHMIFQQGDVKVLMIQQKNRIEKCPPYGRLFSSSLICFLSYKVFLANIFAKKKMLVKKNFGQKTTTKIWAKYLLGKYFLQKKLFGQKKRFEKNVKKKIVEKKT